MTNYKMVKPGFTYECSDPENVGSFYVRQELEVLPNPNPPVKGWTVGRWVAIDGNKYLRLLKDYVKKVNKESEDDLSQEEIENLYSQCEY